MHSTVLLNWLNDQNIERFFLVCYDSEFMWTHLVKRMTDSGVSFNCDGQCQVYGGSHEDLGNWQKYCYHGEIGKSLTKIYIV